MPVMSMFVRPGVEHVAVFFGNALELNDRPRAQKPMSDPNPESTIIAFGGELVVHRPAPSTTLHYSFQEQTQP